MSIKPMLSASLKMKFLSFLLAITLWLFVVFETADQVELPLSVSYVNIPGGLVLKGDSGSGLFLRVEGPRILLLRQKLKRVSVQFDLSGASEGSVDFSEIVAQVRLIHGVRALGVSPIPKEPILVASPVAR